MDLLEYQGKQLFARHGIPVPDGRPARTVDEAVAAAKEIGFPCAVKAQVKIGGRGKAGGIKIANDEDEARAAADAILGMDIKGFTVHEVWIETAAPQIESEYYASIVFDRGAKAPLIMLSTQGGMDIGILTPSFSELPRSAWPGETFVIGVSTAPGARCSGQVSFRDHPPIDLDEQPAPGGACSWTVTVPRRCALAPGNAKTTVGGCPSLRASAAPMSKRAGPPARPAAGRTDSPK